MSDAAPEFSFIIPARNEELLLAQTLAAIREAATGNGITYEIIVVDDGSTDQTARVATSEGARLVSVELHNIGAVRNAGAAVAQGEVLYFLDADTLLPKETLAAARQALRNGAVGGGGSVRFDAPLTWFQTVLASAFSFLWLRVCQWAAGCNIFVLRKTFEATGGFDPKYFAAEEKYLSEAIKQQGKFVILREAVITSARKLRIFSTAHLLKVAFSGLVLKGGRMTDRQGLEILYDAPRESHAPSQGK
ncbi:glycosyltransferase [Planctomicrobium sp. SH664]|uniref:glycosyltransferase n=1 Tax=Planctomicrobium sp. SH664 TaxID=3448125 RepID=UPI003F5B88E2